jgi:hypothetical protein
MTGILTLAPLWLGLALIATLLAIWLRIAAAMSEVVVLPAAASAAARRARTAGSRSAADHRRGRRQVIAYADPR